MNEGKCLQRFQTDDVAMEIHLRKTLGMVTMAGGHLAWRGPLVAAPSDDNQVLIKGRSEEELLLSHNEQNSKSFCSETCYDVISDCCKLFLCNVHKGVFGCGLVLWYFKKIIIKCSLCLSAISGFMCPFFHHQGVSPHGPPPTEDQCSPNPCQNSAICRARGDGYSCFCVPGFQGAHCQIDVNECASEPCGNGATCVDRVGDFSCLCPPGFTGE